QSVTAITLLQSRAAAGHSAPGKATSTLPWDSHSFRGGEKCSGTCSRAGQSSNRSNRAGTVQARKQCQNRPGRFSPASKQKGPRLHGLFVLIAASAAASSFFIRIISSSPSKVIRNRRFHAGGSAPRDLTRSSFTLIPDASAK